MADCYKNYHCPWKLAINFLHLFSRGQKFLADIMNIMSYTMRIVESKGFALTVMLLLRSGIGIPRYISERFVDSF